MSAKAFVRALIPPFIWEAAHIVKELVSPTPAPVIPMADVRFSSWDDACRAAGRYDDEALTRFRAARFSLNVMAGNLPALESQPLYWLAKILGTSLRITDFGGSFGEYGIVFRSAFPESTYTVVETGAVVSAGSSGPVNFMRYIPADCDVFYTSGTLQYLADPYVIVEKGFRSAAKAVVLSRNCFSDNDMIRVQQSSLYQNGGGNLPEGFEDAEISYPIRTISETRIAETAKSAGFELLSRTPEPPAFPDKAVYGVQLVYLRHRRR